MSAHLDLAEVHVWEGSPSEQEMDREARLVLPLLHGHRRVLDIGCGEGHRLAALRRAGLDAEGVDLTPSLVERARSRGLPVTAADAAAFIGANASRFDAFLMFDFVEHVPVDVLLRILESIPKGALVLIQTPNTNSIIGHQFYLQVPSHIVPYSPFVLHKLLQRFGFTIQSEDTLYGGLPWTGLRRRITEFILVKLVGTVTARLLTEGANYAVTAVKDR